MPAPPLPPIAPTELVELARGVIRDARFPQLATIDGDQPRLRPVSPVKVAVHLEVVGRSGNP